jgi:hypothetical protein
MIINDDTNTLLSRRAFLGQSGIGLGALAATSLLNDAGGVESGRNDLPHFPAKAKRVIYMFQSGGPSHIDLFDHSPAYQKVAWQRIARQRPRRTARYRDDRRAEEFSGLWSDVADEAARREWHLDE